MTLKDYEHIQWYVNLVFWLLELSMILLVISRRKILKPFLFISFLIAFITWFVDTNSIVFKPLYQMGYYGLRTLKILAILYTDYIFYMILFYFYLRNEKIKKFVIPLILFYIVVALYMMYYNVKHQIYFTLNIPILSYIIILPISIYSLFQINSNELDYNWNLSPSYLFFCAILINFLGNSAFELFASVFMNSNESLLSIILTIRLFIWIMVCLFFIAGLYQLGRNNKA